MRNRGPSPILSSTLIIHWPLGIQNSADQSNLAVRDFFLYITTIDSANLQCDQTYINIRDLRTSIVIIDEGDNNVVPNGRRRRRENLDTKALHRNARETGTVTESVVPTNVTFDTLPAAYITFTCVIGRLAGGAEYELQVNTRVFEPTLVINSPDNTWTFTVNVTGLIGDTHARQMEGHFRDSSHIVVTLVPSRIFGIDEPFNLWWVIIVAIGVFIALLIPLFLMLYFAGFFKKSKAQTAKDDYERKLKDWNEKGNAKPDF